MIAPAPIALELSGGVQRTPLFLTDRALVEWMARTAYIAWHKQLNAPSYEDASEMVVQKFRLLVEAMLNDVAGVGEVSER